MVYTKEGEIYVCLTLLTLIPLSSAWNSSDVQAIRKNGVLSSNYDRLVRPSKITNVSVALNLLTINYMDIKNQVLSTTGWLEASWEDYRLAWDVTKYPDITDVFADESEVWRPVFFIDNSVSDLNIISDSQLLYRITHTGEVEWEQPQMFTTHCRIDITYYPFDTQLCQIKLTSWGYSTDEIELHPTFSGIITEDLEPNGEWLLLQTSAKKNELIELGANGVITKHWEIVFTIVTQRRTSYYVTGILLPVFLLSYLNTLVFILPVESGEKIGFILTVLLSLAVLLTIITDKIPSTSIEVSILSVYLAITLCFSVVSCILSVFVMSVSFQETSKPLPRWAEKLAKSNIFPSAWLTKCSNCTMASRNKTSCNVQAFNENNDLDFKERSQTEKVDGDSQEPESSSLSWSEVSRKLDRLFFYMTFVLITLETIVFLVILMIGGSVNSQKLVNSL
ncbi:neuronal acetylcholine receptor subunit alpha-3-like [Crassostrea angulata]|uniref:neuronal acetylcholine receptor subunit alpha-3-like n=1 Tax=Magallana angulata TaxID=2784310 RepID=UPI0022B0AEA4|nr:neuronal acetylcholine receptor subunit alpha-3-like [Crassostrea angulata]